MEHAFGITFSPTGGTKKAAGMLAPGWAEHLPPWTSPTIGRTSPPDLHPGGCGGHRRALLRRPGARPGGGAAKRAEGEGRAVLTCACTATGPMRTAPSWSWEARPDRRAFHHCRRGRSGGASIAHRHAARPPDAQDEEQLRQFAGQIREKLTSGVDTGLLPRQSPLPRIQQHGHGAPSPPGLQSLRPVRRAVSVQAIDRKDPRQTDKTRCISCMRCAAICPRSPGSSTPCWSNRHFCLRRPVPEPPKRANSSSKVNGI